MPSDVPHTEDDESHHCRRLMVVKDGEEWPDLTEFTDLECIIPDFYSGRESHRSRGLESAVRVVMARFSVTAQEVRDEFTILIAPFANLYDDDGRLFAKRG